MFMESGFESEFDISSIDARSVGGGNDVLNPSAPAMIPLHLMASQAHQGLHGQRLDRDGSAFVLEREDEGGDMVLPRFTTSLTSDVGDIGGSRMLLSSPSSSDSVMHPLRHAMPPNITEGSLVRSTLSALSPSFGAFGAFDGHRTQPQFHPHPQQQTLSSSSLHSSHHVQQQQQQHNHEHSSSMPGSTFMKRADSPGLPTSPTISLDALRSSSSSYGVGSSDQEEVSSLSAKISSWGLALEAKTPPPAAMRSEHWDNRDSSFSPAFAELTLGSFASQGNLGPPPPPIFHGEAVASSSQWNPPLMIPSYRTPSPNYHMYRHPPQPHHQWEAPMAGSGDIGGRVPTLAEVERIHLQHYTQSPQLYRSQHYVNDHYSDVAHSPSAECPSWNF
jgi:hypothetical protein